MPAPDTSQPTAPPAGPSFSFEFFPPKSAQAMAELESTASELASLNPSCLTVTYGAGGSTRDGTFETLERLGRLTATPLAAHLTFCGTPKPDLEFYSDRLWKSGVRHLVALRGDLPAGKSMADYTGDEFFHYTSEFVTALKKRHDFEISVGAYPEKHPDAPSLALDIEALKKKCAAGATRAITQMFFSNEIYYRFLDLTAQAGITTPIVPGLLPIHDFSKTVKFATTCRATLPPQLHHRFTAHAGNADDARKLAEEVLTEQIMDLQRNGIDHFHFYTLNRSDLCVAACKAAGLAV